MLAALVSGELATDPQERTAANGSRYVTANLRAAAGSESVFVSVVAFDTAAADRLLKLRKGGAVAVAGAMEPSSWVGRDGAERHGWRMVACEALTVHAARKKREPHQGEDDPRSVTRLWRDEQARDRGLG
jgi:single-stranded DNA-binding protein